MTPIEATTTHDGGPLTVTIDTSERHSHTDRRQRARARVSPIRAARLYRHHYLAVLPLATDTKGPTEKAWATKPPTAAVLTGNGVGLLTGPTAELVVVDVDTKPGHDGDPTPFVGTTGVVARTPSGGFHFYYARDGATASMQGARPGVDLLADGGRQVAAWPTRLPHGAYRFEGMGLRSLLRRDAGLASFATVRHLFPHLHTTTRAPAATHMANGHDTDPKAPWLAALWTHGSPVGRQGTDLMRLAGWYAKIGQPQDITIAQLWTAVRTWKTGDPAKPWTREAVETGVQNAYAKEAAKPTVDTAGMTTTAAITIAVKAAVEAVLGARKKPDTADMTVEDILARGQTAAAWARQGSPDIRWVVPGWVAYGAITSIEGPPKSRGGKTTFASWLVRAIVDGGQFLDAPATKERVIWLSEQPQPVFRPLLHRAGLDNREELKVYYFQHLAAAQFESTIKAMIADVKHSGANVVVIDTVSVWAKLEGTTENDTGTALHAMALLQPLLALGCAIVLIRHERKRGGEVGRAGRGNTAWEGAINHIIQVRRPKGDADTRVRAIAFSSHFDDYPPLRVRLRDPNALEGEGYTREGAFGRTDAAAETILAAVPGTTVETAVTKKVITGTLPETVKRATLTRVLKALVDGKRLRQTPAGRYYRAGGKQS